MGGPTSTRVTFEGHRLDARTRDMLIAARVVCDAPLVITQGCYNAGGVAASAGTHDGGGALDIRAKTLSDAQIAEAVLKLRHVGFAAWHRTPAQGNWVEHIHCIAIGCPDLSSGAAYQVTAYKNGRNGLANNGKDDGPRTYVSWTWEKYKQTYPDLLTEDTLSAKDVQDIKEFIEAREKAYSAFLAKNLTQQLATLAANVEALEKKYTIAANDYTRQDGDSNTASVLGAVTSLKGDVTALQSQVTSVKADVAGVKAAVEALPKAG